ncbi:hypothetical protein AB0D97_20145, partial [Streptomyces roseus]
MPVLRTPAHTAGRRPCTALLAAVLLLGAAGGAAVATATATAAHAEEPGWTAGPAAGGAGPARPYFYLAGPPGTVLEDRLALTNTSDREHTVTLRGADACNTADGALAVSPAAPPAAAARRAGDRPPPARPMGKLVPP